MSHSMRIKIVRVVVSLKFECSILFDLQLFIGFGSSARFDISRQGIFLNFVLKTVGKHGLFSVLKVI